MAQWKSVTRNDAVTASGFPLQLQFDPVNDSKLPLYHKLNVSVLYNFKRPITAVVNYKLGASIQNLYNRKSTINREFRLTPGLNNSFEAVDFTSLGITPNISFRVEW